MDPGVQDYNNDGFIIMADLQHQNQVQTEYGNTLAAQQQQNLVNQQQSNYLNAALGNLNTGGSLWGNMLGGGMTVNVGDVYAQDGTDFANKLADALPYALRRVSDRGCI